MRRLKPAPDPWIELPGPAGDARAYRPARGVAARWLGAPRLRSQSRPGPSSPSRAAALGVLGGVELAFVAVWTLLTLPFRIVFGVFGLVGRLAGLVVGFGLMVLGAALLAGPLVVVGLPLFGVGLILSMRSLG